MEEQPITHKTNEEIAKEVEVDFDQFFTDKKFNESSPLQYTNSVVVKELAKQANEATKNKKTHDPRGFVGSAVRMYQTDYSKYRETMEQAGWEYVTND